MDFKSFLEYTAAKNEEVEEEINEISKDLTKKYLRTAVGQVQTAVRYNAGANRDPADKKVASDIIRKRNKGIHRAINKLGEEIISEHDFEVGDKVTIKASNKQGKVVKIDNYGTEDEVYHVKVDDNIYKQDPKSLKEDMDLSQCLKFATQSLEEEEQAIKDYTDRIKKCTDKELKKILSHALEEERHHAKMLRDWINKRSGE